MLTAATTPVPKEHHPQRGQQHLRHPADGRLVQADLRTWTVMRLLFGVTSPERIERPTGRKKKYPTGTPAGIELRLMRDFIIFN